MHNYLTIAEAAVFLELSRQRIQQLVQEGRLPAERAGNFWLIPREAVEQMKAQGPGRPGRPRKVEASDD